MSDSLPVSEYGDFLAREYLSSFVAEGGAAVKVAIAPSSREAEDLSREVTRAATALRYTCVYIDAALVRTSLVQQVFFAVARAVDWRSAARAIVRDAVFTQFHVAIEGNPTLEAIGEATHLDVPLVRQAMLRGLQDSVYRNYRLAKDFRIAMWSYCIAELQSDASSDQSRQALNEWLCGDLRLIGAVKDKGIFQKIGRHNARVMVASTARWLRQAGGKGLLIVMDIGRLANPTKQDTGDGLHYAPTHVMDTYEVLRQFIDATDEMEGVMLLITAPQSLLDDERRGFPAYKALQNRIWDDVRDSSRQNPYAPMVRLSAVEVRR
ncbi:MAG: hypothetical protein PVSMB7_20740 [Chloroflexota bacterium]